VARAKITDTERAGKLNFLKRSKSFLKPMPPSTMNNLFKLAGFLLLLAVAPFGYGQDNKEAALAKTKQAIKLEDEEGKYDEAIKLLKEAQQLNPEDITYPYELSYAYSAKKEYKAAAEILEKLVNHKDVYGRIYQALGNAYDYQGMPGKAIETYKKGLEKFPGSGELYLELGNMDMMKKDYDKAIVYYENGIKADPKFPSNYYWAATLYCQSKEPVWGMLYGEIFMNLERSGKRTETISKLLFDTYKDRIKFTDTSLVFSFSKDEIDVSTIKDPKHMKLPFDMMVYEKNIALSVIGLKQIDINSLDLVRTHFVELYFKSDEPKEYPNVLFDYQQSIVKAGHFEAYNHWLLSKGDEDGFQAWYAKNKDKWSAFIKWYTDNKLALDDTHKFYRTQY
jgi:tetratricopeptide (TPR) repeat protein